MGHKWIIDVLSDMEAYATANGLSRLAELLGDAALTAASEVASLDHGETARDGQHDVIDYHPRKIGALRLA